MFESFTDRARKVFAVSNQYAQRYRHEYIAGEDVFLALIDDEACVGGRALARLTAPHDRRAELKGLVDAGLQRAGPSPPPPSGNAKRILALAFEEARLAEVEYVGTGHILLALIRAEGSTPAALLSGLGIDTAKARAAIAEVAPEYDRLGS